MTIVPLKNLAVSIGKWIGKHSPTILTVMGTGGIVTTVALAVKATPRAMEHIDAKKTELNIEKLPAKEVIKVCWKDYALTGGMMLATMSCFIGANVIGVKQQAAIAGLYSLAEQGLLTKDKEISALKREMVNNLGEEKAQEIQQKIEQEKPKKPLKELKGSKMYTFKFAGQLFEATPYRILMIENRLNRKMWGEFEMCLSLNDILSELDLETNDIFGSDTGINRDDGLEFRFGEMSFTDDGECYIPLMLGVPPHKNYRM